MEAGWLEAGSVEAGSHAASKVLLAVASEAWATTAEPPGGPTAWQAVAEGSLLASRPEGCHAT